MNSVTNIFKNLASKVKTTVHKSGQRPEKSEYESWSNLHQDDVNLLRSSDLQEGDKNFGRDGFDQNPDAGAVTIHDYSDYYGKTLSLTETEAGPEVSIEYHDETNGQGWQTGGVAPYRGGVTKYQPQSDGNVKVILTHNSPNDGEGWTRLIDHHNCQIINL